ncbi:MAG: hypothetical protein ACRYHQ_03615 [Janthinobacterium lividum]
MGLTHHIVEFLAAVITGVTVKQASDEMTARTPRTAIRLMERAIRRLSPADQERFREEWASHLEETPGHLSKLWEAIGFVFAARKMSRKRPAISRLFRLAFRPLSAERELLAGIVNVFETHRPNGLTDSDRMAVVAFVKSQATSRQLIQVRLAVLRGILLGHEQAGTTVGEVLAKLVKQASDQ